MMTDNDRAILIRLLAARYEQPAFLDGDPSWFMHQVRGRENAEMMGFLASVLSYGRRDLFLPKIQYLLDSSEGEPQRWVRDGLYSNAIADNDACYYRLYSNRMMRSLLDALREMVTTYGSLGDFARTMSPHHKALETLTGLADWFVQRGIKGMVPSPKTSVAKRPCMFLRWMVRDGSPVDLGLWTDFIDKRSLFIPLDTHVMQEAQKLGLISAKSASWRTVITLTAALSTIFPDDPTKGDFALFGYGITEK